MMKIKPFTVYVDFVFLQPKVFVWEFWKGENLAEEQRAPSPN